MAAEQNDGGGEIGTQAEFLAHRDGVGIGRDVKFGAQDHAGSAKNMRLVVAESARLLCGAFRAGNDVLVFQGLDPKAWRKVGEIGDERDEGTAGIDFAPALAEFAIEMRDDRDEQIGGVFAPVTFEQAQERTMEEANSSLQET